MSTTHPYRMAITLAQVPTGCNVFSAISGKLILREEDLSATSINFGRKAPSSAFLKPTSSFTIKSVAADRPILTKRTKVEGGYVYKRFGILGNEKLEVPLLFFQTIF